MRCVICKTGETSKGHATVTLQRGPTVVVVRDVPADICSDCGEYYLEAGIAKNLCGLADDAVARHAEVEVLRYAA